MSALTVPVLTHDFQIAEGILELKIYRESDGKTISLRSHVGLLQLNTLKEEFFKKVDCFSEALSGSKWIALNILSEQIAYLTKLGIQLLYELFSPSDLRLWQNFAREACPQWQTPYAAGSRLVLMKAPLGYMLPIELLPILDFSPNAKMASAAWLTESLCRFPGFSMLVTRQVKGVPAPVRDVMDNSKGLSVRLLHDLSLDGARRELRFFRDHPSLFILDGPHPRPDHLADDVRSAMAQLICNPQLSCNGSSLPFPIQILHFACHCETRHQNSDRHCINLNGTGAEAIRCTIYLDELVHNIAQMMVTSALSDTTKPLTVLNGCSTSTVRADAPRSLAGTLLRLERSRGFIGTDAKVPDMFAASLTENFYRRLVNGMTVGDSLFYSRWSLAADYQNPLGILYTLYADPDLRTAVNTNVA